MTGSVRCAPVRRALGGTLVLSAALVAACGDDGKPDRTVAFLRTTAIEQASQDAFLEQLDDAGWTVGENLTVLAADVTERYEDVEEARDAVAGWVEEGADLIVALSTSSAIAATEATDDVPILTLANDPVGSGLVSNPREPEGNLTGVSFRVPPDRTLDVARQAITDLTTIGLLWPADDPGALPVRDGLLSAAATLGVPVVDASFAGPDGVRAAVRTLADAGVEITLLANAPATVRAFDALERELDEAGIAALGNTNVNDWAMIVFAPDNREAYRQLGRQAVRILEGRDVADVPLEDPGDYTLLVRADVAQRLGIELTPQLLDQADQVTD